MEKNTIFGIGLPRTGSTSLAEALRLLQYKGSNYCSLFQIKTEDTNIKNYSFNIDNSYYNRYQNLVLANPKSQFILTTRSETEWKKSIRNKSKVKLHNFLSRDRHVPMLDLLPHVKEYEKKVIDFFNQKSIDGTQRLLVLNIFENTDSKLWDKLCDFISVKEENKPTIPFPHVNISR